MNKNVLQKIMELTIFTMLFLTLTPIQFASTNRRPTVVRVAPSKVVVAKENSQTTDKPYTVNVTVEDVVDLYAWQIKLYFDSATISTTWERVGYPSGHVFAGRRFVDVTAAVLTDAEGHYVKVGASLLEEEATFNGSGTLFQINFAGIAEGVSTLIFSKPIGEDTFLWNSNLEHIPFMVADARPSSRIILNIESATTTAGRDLTIDGTITPTVIGVNVAIYYRVADGEWNSLVIVKTDSQSLYSYVWRPTKEGSYEIKASWSGDDNINPAISEAKLVKVEPPPNVASYVVAAITTAIIALLYLTRIRKHQPANNNG